MFPSFSRRAPSAQCFTQSHHAAPSLPGDIVTITWFCTILPSRLHVAQKRGSSVILGGVGAASSDVVDIDDTVRERCDDHCTLR